MTKSELIDKWTVQRAEMQTVLEGLESRHIYIGNPEERRTEAMIADLQHKIRILDQLIATEKSRETNGSERAPMTTDERHALARDLVIRGRAVVARQRLLIAEIRRSGGDAVDAEEVLASFESSLARFEDDLATIEDPGPKTAPT